MLRGVERNSRTDPKAFIDARCVAIPESGCWIWTAHCVSNGYGRVCLGGRKKKMAHRMSWETYFGEIPDDMRVCHKCDTPSCVNPNHLFLGTMEDNAHDRDRKGRQVTQRGSAHKLSKITESDAVAIRGSSETCRALSTRYGISTATVHRIKRGLAWSHA